MTTRSVFFSVTIGLALIVGCRDDGAGAGGQGVHPGNGGSGGSGGSGGPAPTTVRALRMMSPPDGTKVAFQNVVVVGRVASQKYAHLWVQDAGGGPQSGIHLFCNYGGSKPNCMGSEMNFEQFTAGQVVSVTGAVSRYLARGAPASATQLEIDAPVITPAGRTMMPVATSVQASVVAKDQVMADAYKGMYVELSGSFRVAEIKASEFERECTPTSTSTPIDASTSDASGRDAGTRDAASPTDAAAAAVEHLGFELDMGGARIAIGLNFYESLTYCLAESCPGVTHQCTNAITNQTFSRVQGVVEPDFNSDTGEAFLKVSPVTDSDLSR
jgi:hypothetical protein